MLRSSPSYLVLALKCPLKKLNDGKISNNSNGFKSIILTWKNTKLAIELVVCVHTCVRIYVILLVCEIRKSRKD